MPSLVVDTHAAIWYLLQSSRLSTKASNAMDETLNSGDSIFLASTAADRLIDGIQDSKSNWVLAPLDLAVSQELSKVPRDAVPDMPDRVIAATALHLKLPLVTVDNRLRSSGIETIW